MKHASLVRFIGVIALLSASATSCGGGGGGAAAAFFWHKIVAGEWMVWEVAGISLEEWNAWKASSGKGELPPFSTSVVVRKIYSGTDFCGWGRIVALPATIDPCVAGNVRLSGAPYPVVMCTWLGTWGTEWTTEAAMLDGEAQDELSCDFLSYVGQTLVDGGWGYYDVAAPADDELCLYSVGAGTYMAWDDGWRPGDSIAQAVDEDCTDRGGGAYSDSYSFNTKIAATTFPYDSPAVSWGAESVYLTKDDADCPGAPVSVRGISRAYGPGFSLFRDDEACV